MGLTEHCRPDPGVGERLSDERIALGVSPVVQPVKTGMTGEGSGSGTGSGSGVGVGSGAVSAITNVFAEPATRYLPTVVHDVALTHDTRSR